MKRLRKTALVDDDVVVDVVVVVVVVVVVALDIWLVDQKLFFFEGKDRLIFVLQVEGDGVVGVELGVHEVFELLENTENLVGVVAVVVVVLKLKNQ